MHGALTLATRCELAICGHICYDLWALTSSQREKEQNVAKGKFQLARQTRRNLQAVALSTVVMCASKSDDWDAFRHPHGLSEIHIERFFGVSVPIRLQGICLQDSYGMQKQYR